LNNKRPLIIAHRGAAGEAPENTKAAFQLAMEQGCDGFELDVHVSSDGQIIVCHDPNIKRTTDGRGLVADMTVKQLKRYDAGSWFNESYAGERIPLLEEIFDLAPPTLMINVEIKSYRHPLIAQRLVELLRQYGRTEQVILSSFDYECLYRIHRIEPAIKIGLLYEYIPIRYSQLASRKQVTIHSLHPHQRFISKSYVEAAKRAGLHIYPWTIDRPHQMQLAIDAGASGIITNYPKRLKDIMG
jgi:glycerophosphoryl diester phosphodiesterase